MDKHVQYRGIDCLKFLMALIIVGMHACIYERILGTSYVDGIIKRFIGLCVPTFLVISAFFFFRKVNAADSMSEKFRHLVHFEKRIFLLYLFWVIVQLPYVIHLRHYNQWLDVLVFVKNFFFGSTFIASWYLGAMITGMPIVFLVCVNKPCRIIVTLFTCLVYIAVYQHVEWGGVISWYKEYVSSPIFSFPRALLWLTLGYYLTSIHNSKISAWLSSIILIVLLIVSPIFPYDYISIPIVAAFFMFVKKLSMPYSSIYKKFRIYSTVIYCSHGSMLALIGFVFHPGYFLVPLTIIACILLSEIIYRLSKSNNKMLALLRYAY